MKVNIKLEPPKHPLRQQILTLKFEKTRKLTFSFSETLRNLRGDSYWRIEKLTHCCNSSILWSNGRTINYSNNSKKFTTLTSIPSCSKCRKLLNALDFFEKPQLFNNNLIIRDQYTQISTFLNYWTEYKYDPFDIELFSSYLEELFDDFRIDAEYESKKAQSHVFKTC